jgi:hypothetical protein
MHPSRRRRVTTFKPGHEQQLLALHSAIADKLIADPSLVPPLVEKLEQRYQAGLIKHYAYIRWSSLLDALDDPAYFKTALLENSETMRRLRHKSLLTGILTEQERAAALQPLL